MKLGVLFFALLISITAWSQENTHKILNENGETISKRFLPPEGFVRVYSSQGSFECYLQNIRLKPNESKVKFYNGVTKPNFRVYDAVIDMEIGTRDLQQCADAVMRLRGEFIYSTKQFNKIHFNFTNGFRVDYAEWMKGNRIVVEGNKSYWKKTAKPDNSYKSFRKYMDIIFAYAGTLSLEKELITVNIKDIKIGDIFIQGGSPGHAVIVVDMAENENGDKVFLLAQSYMPAQDIHVLKNLMNKKISPWYNANFENELVTPEWTFNKNDLKRFED